MSMITKRTNKDGQTVFRIRVKVNGKEYQRTYPAKNEPPIPDSWSYKKALKEAENVILDYIDECEEEKKRNLQKSKIRNLKAVNIFLIALLVVAIIF